MSETSPRKRPYACAWCGREMVDSDTGRRRKYCKRSCRQRAYEQRTLLEGTAIPGDALILNAAEAEALGDRLFELRCAAEDIRTALDEGTDVPSLRAMAADLVRLADRAERLR
ncbi:hypothetical protein nbrc107696_33360 [Gordonia spumicola]|uniref:Uncharacterized protein n=1 Tax=Gordonia spumicola TaxID=589161 RepID=A0A7I9VD15_9ACTN|nr:hypothetical protein [Gordonia spumicola]GEE02890.1 hypothetical protein nbrc107696_33360 [Gordonia spumicola]